LDDDEYADDYGPCARTYASLNAYNETGHYAAVTESLAVEPTGAHDAGDTSRLINGEARDTGRPCTKSFWSISTERRVASRDARRHVDHLLELLDGKGEHLRTLREAGWRFRVSIFWESKYGHGGPILGPQTMRRLAELELEIWFDCYYLDRESDPPEVEGHPDWRPLKL